MAKSLRDILGEVAQPKAQGEKDFKDKHVVQDNPYPAKGTDDVVNARKQKPAKGGAAKTKKTHMEKEEEETVYENVEDVIDEILAEDDVEEDELVEAVIDTIRNIVKTNKEGFVLFDDETEMEVDPVTAQAIDQVFEMLSDDNAVKFTENLNKSQESFLRMVDFAVSVGGDE